MNKNKPVRFPTRQGELDYSILSEETLLELFALYDRLGASDQLNQVAHEMRRRAVRGELSIFEQPPHPTGNVPKIFKIWPFSLFWRQRSR